MEDTHVTKGKTKRRIFWTFGLLILLCIVARFTILVPRDPGILFGPDTTYVDAPKNPDGTPNYVAWLNQKYSKGVTADNNAAVLIAKVLDSRYSESVHVPGLKREDLRRLGLDQTTEADKVFVELRTVAAQSGKNKSVFDLPRTLELEEKAWSAEDYPLVSRWIDENKGALDTFVAASKRTHYFMPYFSRSETANLYDAFSGWGGRIQNDLARVLTVRAMRSLNEGDTEAAWKDSMALRRMGRLLSQSPVTLDYSIGSSLDAKAHRIFIRLVSSGRLDAPTSHRFLADLKTLGEFQTIAGPLEADRLSLLATVILHRRDGSCPCGGMIAKPKGIDYNTMLRYCNSYWDEVKTAAKLPRPDREIEYKRIRRSLEVEDKERYKTQLRLFKIGGLLFEEGYARTLICRIICATTSDLFATHVPDMRLLAEVKIDLSKVVLALAAYKAEKGEYPKALEALKPVYLDEIPQDRFTRTPLIYTPGSDGYVLYSAGSDGKDDGGATNRMRDIVVRIPVEEKVKPAK